MTILKSEQILSESPKSWQDAAETAVKRFAKTMRNARSAYINDLSAVIEDGKVKAYRVNLQVTFEVDEPSLAKLAAARVSGSKSRRTPARKTRRRARA
jgi:flavin-binding protein dodecin